MAKISTKELIHNYFETKDEQYRHKLMNMVDRPELYAYEIKIGKQLVEMNSEEILDMFSTFGISYFSFRNLSSIFKQIFIYYQRNYELIFNPFDEEKLKGTKAAQKFIPENDRFGRESFDTAIEAVRSEFDTDRAKYMECIMLLFYDGFSKAEEIAILKESMIDFETKEVHLNTATVQLSDRCFELLTFVHLMQTLPGHRTDYTMTSWNDGYFKFPVASSRAAGFNDRPLEYVANFINIQLSKIRKISNTNISFRNLYLLGFYEKAFVEKYGEERSKEMIWSVRDSEANSIILEEATRRGIPANNVTNIKNSIRQFS